MNYYNEFDPKAATWLREIMVDGLIPRGEVDERSIREVQPADLAGFAQCHFFAGIGGWPLALDLAGWPRRRPVWTGSCPCQPYSAAGKGRGDADDRNLWPDFFRLIRECRPEFVVGEQVEAAIRHGWLDGISADLEGEGYSVGAVVLGAHSVGSPHIRQRLYWLAESNRIGHHRWKDTAGTREPNEHHETEASGSVRGLADADGRESGHGELQRGGQHGLFAEDGGTGDGLGDAIGEGLEGFAGDGDDGHEPGRIDPRSDRPTAPASPVGPRVRTFAERNPVPTEFVAGILDPDETDEDDTVLVPEDRGGEARV